MGGRILRNIEVVEKKILETGYISNWDYLKTVCVQLIVALIPKKLRLLVFTKLLR